MSLLGTLAAAARMALPAIARGVREGLSIAKIGQAIRSGGIKIANDSLRELVNQERKIWTHGNSLKFLNQETRPNPRSLPESLGALRRQFSFTVRVRGILTSTGKSIEQNVTVSTDSVLIRRQIEGLAREAVERQRVRYGIDIDELLLIRGVKAGTAGVF